MKAGNLLSLRSRKAQAAAFAAVGTAIAIVGAVIFTSAITPSLRNQGPPDYTLAEAGLIVIVVGLVVVFGGRFFGEDSGQAPKEDV